MSTSLIVIEGGDLLASLGPDFTAAFDLAKAEKAPATRKAYGTDFRLFKVYCDAKGVSALPAAPETVASYIAAEAQTAKPSTIGRRIAAIRYAHKLAGFDTPTDAEACGDLGQRFPAEEGQDRVQTVCPSGTCGR